MPLAMSSGVRSDGQARVHGLYEAALVQPVVEQLISTGPFLASTKRPAAFLSTK
jgi:hypothetical protein